MFIKIQYGKASMQIMYMNL